MTYSEALNELKDIINQIEASEIDIDQIQKKLERSKKLLDFCRTKLKKTEDFISELNEKDN